MPRDFDSSVYQRIAGDLAEQIDHGELVNGQQIPKRTELQERYGVSRQVVQNALTLLHNEGYLESNSSRGTFVKRLPRLTLPMYSFEESDQSVDAFVSVVKEQGRVARQVIEAKRIVPELEIARQLAVEDDGLVVLRGRVRFVDDVPYAITDSYFPLSKVQGSRIEDPRDIEEGGRHVLAELGFAMVKHSDSIVARRPTRDEVRRLQMAPGCAVIAHNRLSLTAGGEPIRLLATVLPSDRWTISYDLDPVRQ